jgi:hypothetical protein
VTLLPRLRLHYTSFRVAVQQVMNIMSAALDSAGNAGHPTRSAPRIGG